MRYKISEIQLAGNKQANDAKAMLVLLNEQMHENVTMHFTNANAGRAKTRIKHFTIPIHALKSCETYLLYYVIHEFTHCITNKMHDTKFKFTESALCSQFGISIDYARAYPKRLYYNGQTVYEKKGLRK
jgi:hypothetical protein